MPHPIKPDEILAALFLVQNLLERGSETLFQPFHLTGAQFNILKSLAQHQDKMEQLAVADALPVTLQLNL